MTLIEKITEGMDDRILIGQIVFITVAVVLIHYNVIDPWTTPISPLVWTRRSG